MDMGSIAAGRRSFLVSEGTVDSGNIRASLPRTAQWSDLLLPPLG